MKRIGNGEEIELVPSDVAIEQMPNHVLVRSGKGTHSAVVVRRGDSVWISYFGQVFEVSKPGTRSGGQKGLHSGEILAAMPGLIVDVPVIEGQTVAKGDRLVVLEAMKTQQPFLAPFDGVVDRILAKAGDQVQDGQLLVRVRATEA